VRNGAVEMVQGMWGPEEVSALLIAVVVIVAREWRRYSWPGNGVGSASRSC
jgi:hypothetical protein